MSNTAESPPSGVTKTTQGVTWIDRLAGHLLRVRPAPVAVLLKKILRIGRHPVSTVHGTMWLDPATLIGAEIVRTGHFEPTMIACLHSHLRDGGTFVDLGANEGYFTIIGGRLVGRHGRVLAIEPQARLLPVIERNIALNDLQNVQIEASAISDKPGTVVFHLAADTNTGGSGFLNSARYKLETAVVPVRRLSDVFDAHKIGTVDLMKVDIEGAEYEALLGSTELFTSHRIKAIALELHPAQLAARGRVASDIETMLTQAGYVCDDHSVWTLRAAH